MEEQRRKKKRKKGVNGRAKGGRVEREFVTLLVDQGMLSARRSSQYSAKVEGDPDIVCSELSSFHLEVKGRKDNALYDWLHQAKIDSRGKTIPMVAIKRPLKPWIVMMGIEEWLKLANVYEWYVKHYLPSQGS